MTVLPGLRDVVQVQGGGLASGLVTRPPARVQVKEEIGETVEYFLDGTPQIDRELRWTSDTVASPDVPRRWWIELAWDSLSKNDYAKLLEIQAAPVANPNDDGPFKLILWRPIVETFTYDGTRNTFLLTFPPAVKSTGVANVTPAPQGFAAYAATVYRNGSVYGSMSVTAWTVTAVGLTQYDVIDIYYVPILYSRRSAAEMEFPAPSIETLRLGLVADQYNL